MKMQTPTAEDINTLLVLTRDLNKKVPKSQNLLGDFGNFGTGGIESMGLPETGSIVVTIDGIPHVRTNFGKTFYDNQFTKYMMFRTLTLKKWGLTVQSI